MVDSFRILHPQRKNVGIYNGFTGQSDGPKIDYIMVKSNIRAIEASILQNNFKGQYPSDHFPVTAQLGLRWMPIKIYWQNLPNLKNLRNQSFH